jgi:hypothetical protein
VQIIGFLAPVATDGHDYHWICSTLVFVGTEGVAGGMGLQRLVLFHLDLLEFSIVGDLIDKARMQRRKPLSHYFDDAAEFVVGGHLEKHLIVLVPYFGAPWGGPH